MSKPGMGSYSTNWPPPATQQHHSMLSAVVGAEHRRERHACEVWLLAVVGQFKQVPCSECQDGEMAEGENSSSSARVRPSAPAVDAQE